MKNFRRSYDAEMSGLKKAGSVFPWENPEAYKMWLGQTYYFARMTTRFLALTGAHLDLSYDQLHQRFMDHVREERGHERILLQDLKAMGAEIHEIPELASTAGFYQSQFYWIQHRHPLSFFGYIITLEGLALEYGTEACRRAASAHGPKAANFLKVHAEEDKDHTEKAFQQLESLHLDSKIEGLIIENFKLSTQLYKLMLKEAAEGNEIKLKLAA